MWFWLAFASSILGAIDIVLNKQSLNKVSSSVLTWALFVLPIPALIYFTLRDGMPSLNQVFFIGVIGSSLFYVFAKTLANETLKQNLVSKVFPLTSFNGLFTYVFGLMFLGESIRFIPILGLVSVVLGSYILNADQAREDFLKPFKSLFTDKTSLIFLFAMMLNSVTAIFDKLGITNTNPNSPTFVLLVESVIMGIILTIYLIKKERLEWVKEIKDNYKILLLNSAVYLIVSLLVFTSLVGGPVALVLGVKRLQVFFILILGYLFFKDKPTRHTWIATLVMGIGVLMIRLG